MSTKLELLTPTNCQVIFIDHQPQMAFGVQSIDRQVLKNNTVALAKAAKVFKIPVTITTVETESFSGHTYPELLAVFPEAPHARAHLDELLGRPEGARRAGEERAARRSSSPACGPRSATTPSRSVGDARGADYEIYMVADGFVTGIGQARKRAGCGAPMLLRSPPSIAPLPPPGRGAAFGGRSGGAAG